MMYLRQNTPKKIWLTIKGKTGCDRDTATRGGHMTKLNKVKLTNQKPQNKTPVVKTTQNNGALLINKSQANRDI
jgi:hypothetical protein